MSAAPVAGLVAQNLELRTQNSLFYVGGIDLPMPQARSIQTLHTAHALAVQGCRVRLAVGRSPRAGLEAVLADYGLESHPNLVVVPLPALHLPKLPIAAYVHPRLAVWNWSYGLAAILALRRLPSSQRPRLVLARDPRLARLFQQARPLTGAAVIYEVHELFSTRSREPVVGQAAITTLPTRAPRIRRLEEAVLRDAAGVITLTEACRRLLIDRFGVPSERIVVAPDAVAQVPSALPARPLDGRTIVYAGQLYPWKGVGTLIRALAHLPKTRLKIVGGLGEADQNAAALSRLAAEQGVLDRIDFTGFLPHTAVAAAMAGASAAAVPLPDNPMARYFTSPLKLYEYMAAGLPIVASDLPSLREVLEDERNALLVPPDDPVALAMALGRLLDDVGLADRLRGQAHLDVAGRTWASRASGMLAFLDGR